LQKYENIPGYASFHATTVYTLQMYEETRTGCKSQPFLAGFSLTNEIVIFEKKRLPPAFSDFP
jgi:hypothetical protein